MGVATKARPSVTSMLGPWPAFLGGVLMPLRDAQPAPDWCLSTVVDSSVSQRVLSQRGDHTMLLTQTLPVPQGPQASLEMAHTPHCCFVSAGYLLRAVLSRHVQQRVLVPATS